jgi:hypothetical protein
MILTNAVAIKRIKINSAKAALLWRQNGGENDPWWQKMAAHSPSSMMKYLREK